MTANTLQGAPEAVSETLTRLANELSAAAGKNLVSLVVFGGLARGKYRPGRSDVNVVLVLDDVSPAALLAVAGPLQRARRAVAVTPLILGRNEVESSAYDFPTKFLDIRDHHIVLAGSDPFRDLTVPRDIVAARVAQELRNLVLRLRHRYIEAQGDVDFLRRALTKAARPLAIQLAALLTLSGGPAPADDTTATIFDAAAAKFGLDRQVLQSLAALRHEPDTSLDVNRLAGDVLICAAKASQLADGLKKGTP